MQKPSYGWLLKWILAAILIAVGFTIFFNQSIVYLTTGIAILVFSIFRIYPLIKSLKKEVLRTLNIVEIVIDLILGGLILYAGIEATNNGGQIDGVWDYLYTYSLVVFFVLRGLVFLYSVVFLGEKTEQPKYWAHIGILMIGAMIFAYPDFNSEFVAWLLLAITLLGGAYLIYDGAKGYGGYRRYSQELNEGKQKDKEKDNKIEKELPNTNQPVVEKEDQDRPFIS